MKYVSLEHERNAIEKFIQSCGRVDRSVVEKWTEARFDTAVPASRLVQETIVDRNITVYEDGTVAPLPDNWRADPPVNWSDAFQLSRFVAVNGPTPRADVVQYAINADHISSVSTRDEAIRLIAQACILFSHLNVGGGLTVTHRAAG